MFARTPRLMLRPGWPEDAAALAHAIAHRAVVANLAHAPWPYGLADAAAFLAQPPAIREPRFLIFDDPAGTPRLVGGIAIDSGADDHEHGPEFGYWLTPAVWGRGYATEAGRAVLDIARDALRLPRLRSGWFSDNPASGRVLAKLGFHATGQTARWSAARGRAVTCETMVLDLAEPPTLALAA